MRAASAKGAKGRGRTPGFMMSEIIDVPFPRAESSCLTSLRIFQLQDEHEAGAQRGGQFPCAAVCSSEQSKHTTRKEPATHIWSVDENDRNGGTTGSASNISYSTEPLDRLPQGAGDGNRAC